MCSPPDSIPILQMLVRITNARRVVEVGVFTGCAAPSQSLPTRAICCEGLDESMVDMCAESESINEALWLDEDGPYFGCPRQELRWGSPGWLVKAWTQTTLTVGDVSRYTALGMALALPADGKLIACDITDEYPSIGAHACQLVVWQDAL